MTDRLLTKQEAATTLGVSVKTIERRLAKGLLTRALVHGPHGPEVRVVFPAPPDVVEATFTVAPETAEGDATPDSRALVQGVAAETPPSTAPLVAGHEDRELAVLALRALAEIREENARLRAAVESLRRPWWRRGWEKMRRRDRV